MLLLSGKSHLTYCFFKIKNFSCQAQSRVREALKETAQAKALEKQEKKRANAASAGNKNAHKATADPREDDACPEPKRPKLEGEEPDEVPCPPAKKSKRPPQGKPMDELFSSANAPKLDAASVPNSGM
jgi:hypothetical protein